MNSAQSGGAKRNPHASSRDDVRPASVDGLTPEPFGIAPPGFFIRAAIGTRRLIQGAADAIVPPEALAIETAIGVAFTMVIGAFARHGIADLLADGPQTAAQLADRAGLDADALHRVLRGLAFKGFLRLHDDGRFENTRVSDCMRRGHVSRAREWCEYWSSDSNVRAWFSLEHTLRTGESAFDHVHGMSVWDWFDAHPDERECFAQCMMSATLRDAPILSGLYPFREVSTICDVGGGRGTLVSELLVRHPHLRATLCDAPGVIASAQPLLAARGVLDRVTCVPGSFFDEVPSGAEAYLLKNILHDWDDARCSKILDVIRRACTPGTRVLLLEAITETHDARSFGAMSDLQMMIVCSGRERSREEFRALLERSRFRLARVFESPITSVIEGVAIE